MSKVRPVLPPPPAPPAGSSPSSASVFHTHLLLSDPLGRRPCQSFWPGRGGLDGPRVPSKLRETAAALGGGGAHSATPGSRLSREPAWAVDWGFFSAAFSYQRKLVRALTHCHRSLITLKRHFTYEHHHAGTYVANDRYCRKLEKT